VLDWSLLGLWRLFNAKDKATSHIGFLEPGLALMRYQAGEGADCDEALIR